MALTADQITAQNFKDFYTQILPYLNKGNGGTSDTPLGQVAFFDDLVAPYGWLVADGSTYNIADYPDLANQYERVHGSKNFWGGNGTTTFAVPDWDAIPTEVFGNSNIICIKAIPSSEMNTYSLTERRVGTWIDGKPLYEKTYNIDLSTKSAITTDRQWLSLQDLSSLSADEIFIAGGFIHADNDSAPLTAYTQNTDNTYWMTRIWDNKIQILSSGTSWYEITLGAKGYVIVTVQYTKTTD